MSEIINDVDENEKNKDLLQGEPNENNFSKKRLLLLYGLTIAGVLLAFLILFSIWTNFYLKILFTINFK